MLVAAGALTTVPGAAAQWQADAGAHAIALYTYADPIPGGGTLGELKVVHPALMGRLVSPGGTMQVDAMVNLEGLTMPDGELTPGTFGEGFIDRRHPHTYLHELMVTVRTGPTSVAGLSASASAGKGFVPFGTDDPMSRPVVRYPVNHHFAQILERAVLIGAVAAGPVVVEGALFNGDEPDRPGAWPSLDRVGDSWAARLTLRPAAGLELQLSQAVVHSPEHPGGAGLDQRKTSTSARWAGAVAGGAAEALGEWARTSEEGFFEYSTFLAEGAWGRGAHRLHYRFERTDRPEEERLDDPFRTPRPHHDDSNLGATRWTIHTAGWSYALPLRLRWGAATAVGELSRAGVTRIAGVLADPGALYGRTSIWTVSLGLRLDLGMPMHRMGRYGVAAAAAAHGTDTGHAH